MALEKQLADTDSVYCTKVTNSNQSSIFISNLGAAELDVLFGANYKSDDAVRLRLNKRNLAFNAVSHVVDGRAWYKRKSSEKWNIDAVWLKDRLAALAEAFTGDESVFIAYLNKDDHSTQRLYMKGVTSLPREDGGGNIALRDFLFSGDVVVLTKLENGDVSFEVKIPDDPVISYASKSGVDEQLIMPEVCQLITYGAPGTGKSHKIDKRTNESNSIRVTFHPDTDYAAFVGAYKPTMESTDKGLLTLQELKTVLQSLKDRGETRPEQKLGAEFWRSFEKLTPADVKSILENDSMYAEVMKGVAVGEYLTRIENGGKQIVYSFVPQAFMKAYVEAWRRYTNDSLQGGAKTYYLVIEEINRGNCAQIFGDLFQLLDRADNGFSAYAITPDDDIQKFLETDKDYKLADISLSEDIKKVTETGEKVIATAADIKTGKKLVLPPNLCIWATMNTSDQSLFPIDSAFKRRWDWEYVPIAEPKESKEPTWQRRVIKIGDDTYDWWKFLMAINDVIYDATKSEDKQLGYFFVKANDATGEITAEQFVNKVLFYLYGDVFKAYELPEGIFGKPKTANSKDKCYRFSEFFYSGREEKDAKAEAGSSAGKKVGTVREDVVKEILMRLGVNPDEKKAPSSAPGAAAEDSSPVEAATGASSDASVASTSPA